MGVSRGVEFFEREALFDEGGGVYYVPMIDHIQGRVGYAVRDIDTGSQEVFIYLNPSQNTKDAPDKANVFVYMGGENDPSIDLPLHHYLTDPRSEDVPGDTAR